MDKIKQAIELHNYQQAYELLEQYMQAGQTYTDTLAILEASIYIGFEDFQKAMRCIEEGLKLNPLNHELYFMLGNVYEAFSLYKKAYLCYENALFHCKSNEEDYSIIQDYFQSFLARTHTTVPGVSIILLTFNNLDYTIKCIDSIRDFCAASCYEIICVDNGSTDGTEDYLKSQSDLKYQLNHKNYGFAAGCNIGIRLANPDNDIFLLNNDTILTENALFWLRMGLYEKEEIGAAGAVSNYAGNGQVISETYHTLSEYMEYGLTHNVPLELPLAYRTLLIGFALLIKRSAYEITGDLDERFFPGNFEDNDYCTRLILNNYKLVVCKNSFIFHFGSKGFSALEEQNPTENYNSAFEINQQRYIDKWHIRPYYSSFYRNELIEQMAPEDKWNEIYCLDIGCACGATLLEIQNHYPNARLYGIELDPYSAAFASHIATVVEGNMETMEFPFDVTFDYIILGDILEHLVEPEQLLKKLKEHLSEQGVIITSIPNILHYSAIGQILMGSFEYADSGILDRTHLRFFTKYNSAKLLQDCGYEIIGFQKLQKTPADDFTSMNNLIDALAAIPGVVDKEQFFVTQYVYKAKPI